MILLLSFTPQTSPWTAVSLLSWYSPACSIDYVTRPCSSSPFRYFLPHGPISYGCQPLFLAWSVFFNAISTFSHRYLFLEGRFPVLLLVLHHSSYLSIFVWLYPLSSVPFAAILRTSRFLPILVLHAAVALVLSHSS